MTLISDTRSALNAALVGVGSATTTAAGDANLNAAMTGPLGTAKAAVWDALDALAAYEATLPLPLVAGLSVTDATPSRGVTNIIVNVRWRDAQPFPGGPVAAPAIDQALAAGASFRVRLFFGRWAPAWAIALSGGGVAVHDQTDNITATVPRWWNTAYQAAQASFVAALAAKYDGLVPAIFAASPMTIYAEPFIRQVGDAQTRARLVAAGYTSAADQASYIAMFNMFAVWKRTRVAVAYNPWQTITTSGAASPTDPTGFAEQMIAEHRRRFPSGIVQNNSIRTPPLVGAYTGVYAAMKASPPLAFQTATMPRIGSLPQTLDWAIAQGAHLVELDPGWEPLLTDAQVASYDAALRANAGAA
jgi:hypothetical protein